MGLLLVITMPLVGCSDDGKQAGESAAGSAGREGVHIGGASAGSGGAAGGVASEDGGGVSGVAAGGADMGGMMAGAGGMMAGAGGVSAGAGGVTAGGESGAAGAGGSGGVAGFGGMGGAAGAAGQSGSTLVDPEGDASTPDLDLVSGALYKDGDFVEIRIRFAGKPLPDGASIHINDSLWSFEITRLGAGMSFRIPAAGLSTGLDPCTHLFADDVAGWLVIRAHTALFSTQFTKTVSVTVVPRAGSGQTGDSAAISWKLSQYPGPLAGASAACAPWSTARTSTLAFKDISLGNGYGCGVTLAGEAICWGEDMALDTLGQAPAGPFDQASVSNLEWWNTNVYACGLRPNGSIECWGGAPPVVAGNYRDIGDPFGCAILDNGDLSCIDMGTGDDEIRSATGPIAEVVGAGVEECHRSDGGEISCMTAGMAPLGDGFIDLAFGTDSEACGLHADGSLDCALASAIPYSLKAIDAGGDASGSEAIGCGLTQGGAPICWGGAGVVAPVPPGPFARIEVSSTSEGACGFRADNTLSCWHYGFRAGNPLPATTPP